MGRSYGGKGLNVLQILTISPVYRLLVTLLFMALIVALSVAPGDPEAGDLFFSWIIFLVGAPLQKSMHVAIYAGLAVLWVWTLEAIESRPLRFGLALLLTVGLGAVLEWCQTMVPGRFGSIADVILNAFGALLGLAAALVLL